MTIRFKFTIIFTSTIILLLSSIFLFTNIMSNIRRTYTNNLGEKSSIIHLYQENDIINRILLTNNLEDLDVKKELLNNLHSDDLHIESVTQEEVYLNNISSSLIALHENYLKLDLTFKEIYKDEKITRYIIRDILDDEKDYLKVKQFGTIMYYSKEAFYQYKDEKHFNDLIEAIILLESMTEDPILKKHIRDYSNTTNKLINVAREQNKIIMDIEGQMKPYNSVLSMADKKIESLTIQSRRNLDLENKRFNNYLVVIVIFLLLAISFILFYVNKEIILPLYVLKEETKNISNKNFKKIDLNKNRNDEIGDLVDGFNLMSKTLSDVYENLEQIVNIRTEELSQANNILKNEISENQKLNLALKEKSETDELTKLFNRRKAYDYLKNVLKEVSVKKTLIISFLDLDNFKNINDTQGHEAGDKCLIDFANSLRKNLREDDYIFRMGGDEFIVSFEGKTLEEVETLLETRIIPGLREDVHIGFSYGLIEISTDKNNNLDLDQILEDIDKKMYAQKQKKKGTRRN